MANQDKSGFVRSRLPWLMTASALVVYLLTLNRWVSLSSLSLVSTIASKDFTPLLSAPLHFLLTFPVRWLPVGWQPVALNAFAAACASSKASSPPANGAPSPAREAQTQSETHAQPQPAAPAPAKAQGGAHGDLASLAERYLSGLFRAKPHLADYMGDHRFVTGHWDLSTSAVRFRISELTEHGKELAALDRSKMSRDEQVDAAIMADAIALELLELARVAAHTQERRFAPLTSYLAGVAAERLRAAKPGIDDAAVAEFILEVRQKLEREVPGL